MYRTVDIECEDKGGTMHKDIVIMLVFGIDTMTLSFFSDNISIVIARTKRFHRKELKEGQCIETDMDVVRE